MSVLIETRELGKRFGRAVALAGVSFALERGAPVALVGPNGAGKTTLLSLLAEFLKPSSGEVRLLGYAPGSPELYGRVGVMPQDAAFDPILTIERQFQLYAELQMGQGAAAARAETARVLSQVGLPEAGALRDHALSHGMRKRMQLAQALIGSPELLLLDEPTAGIDPPNVRAIRSLISEHAHHTQFLISSHNLDELERLCDRVVYLERGRMLYAGSLASAPALGAGVTGPDDRHWLSVRVDGASTDEFVALASQLPGVLEVRASPQGEFLLQHVADVRIDAAVLQLLDQQGWDYRELKRGLSLEERLYGTSSST